MATQGKDQNGRRKSQRRSSILKNSRTRPFDDVLNTYDVKQACFKDRRVSFSNNVLIKEFVKEPTTFDKIGAKAGRDAAIQISTPNPMSRQGRGQHLPSKSIDRLSIIPKFEKSFVEDAEDSDDFEPYADGSPVTSSPPGPTSSLTSILGGKNKNVQAPLASISAKPHSPSSSATKLHPATPPTPRTASKHPTPRMATPPLSLGNSDMEITLNETQELIIAVPEIGVVDTRTAVSSEPANTTAAMSFTMLADQTTHHTTDTVYEGMDIDGQCSDLDEDDEMVMTLPLTSNPPEEAKETNLTRDKTARFDVETTFGGEMVDKTGGDLSVALSNVTTFGGEMDKTNGDLGDALNKSRNVTTFGGEMEMVDKTSGDLSVALNKSCNVTTFGGEMDKTSGDLGDALNKSCKVTTFGGEMEVVDKTSVDLGHKSCTTFGGEMEIGDKTGGDLGVDHKSCNVTTYGGEMAMAQSMVDNGAMTPNRTVSVTSYEAEMVSDGGEMAMTLNRTGVASCEAEMVDNGSEMAMTLNRTGVTSYEAEMVMEDRSRALGNDAEDMTFTLIRNASFFLDGGDEMEMTGDAATIESGVCPRSMEHVRACVSMPTDSVPITSGATFVQGSKPPPPGAEEATTGPSAAEVQANLTGSALPDATSSGVATHRGVGKPPKSPPFVRSGSPNTLPVMIGAGNPPRTLPVVRSGKPPKNPGAPPPVIGAGKTPPVIGAGKPPHGSSAARRSGLSAKHVPPSLPSEAVATETLSSRNTGIERSSTKVWGRAGSSKKRGRSPKSLVHIPRAVSSKGSVVCVSTPLSKRVGFVARHTPKSVDIASYPHSDGGLNSRVTRSMASPGRIDGGLDSRVMRSMASPSHIVDSRITRSISSPGRIEYSRVTRSMASPGRIDGGTVDSRITASPGRIEASRVTRSMASPGRIDGGTVDSRITASPGRIEDSRSMAVDSRVMRSMASPGHIVTRTMPSSAATSWLQRSFDMELVDDTVTECTQVGSRAPTSPSVVSKDLSQQTLASDMESEAGDYGAEQGRLKTSDDLESVSPLLSTTSPLTLTSAGSSISSVSAHATTSSTAVVQPGGDTTTPGDDGNWLQTRDSSLLLVDSSNDVTSPGSAEDSRAVRGKAVPARSSTRRRSSGRKSRRKSLRASLIWKLKEQSQAGSEGVEIDTPEMVPVDHREVAPAEHSIFPSPDVTSMNNTLRKNRQSLMMSPSGFTKFLVNLNSDDRPLEDHTFNVDMDSCPPADCVEVSTVRGGEGEENCVMQGGTVEERAGIQTKDVVREEDSVCTDQQVTNPESSRVQMDWSLHDATPPLPQASAAANQSLPATCNSLAGTLVESDGTVTPPLLPRDGQTSSDGSLSPVIPLQNVPVPPPVSPPPSASPPAAHLPPSSMSVSAQDLREKLEDLLQPHLTGMDAFISHVHSLRTRYLEIAHSCKTRLSSPDYLQVNGHPLFKKLLESIITRANLGISVLTLFISYGDISGLARANRPIPTIPVAPCMETSREEKYQWMELKHDELEQKYSDIEATMVSAAEIYHWQVDCWNQCKVEITIHNSARIALTLEESPLSSYPQRIKRTNVRYVRGSLLFSKPQTEACTSTADIVQLLWTIIRYRGNS